MGCFPSVRAVPLAAALLLWGATTASATIITYAYSGTLTNAQGAFAGLGSDVTGTIAFDDGLVDNNAALSAAQYTTTILPNSNLVGSYTATISIGGTVVATADGSIDSPAFLQLFDLANDSFTYRLGPLSLQDSGGTEAIQGLDNTMNTTIAILDDLNVAAFTTATASTWIETAGTNFAQFTWTDLERVPEPSTAVLLAACLLGALGLARSRR